MADLVIIGIGNPFRGDDAAGWAVIDALIPKVNNAIVLRKNRGEFSEILEDFQTYHSVYLVDAYLGKSPGDWKRIDALHDDIFEKETQTSTHAFSLSQAISLAKTLDQLPTKLILYAICSDRYQLSNNLSPPVIQAVSDVVQSLLQEKEIQICMKNL